MTITITADQLTQILPTNPSSADWVDPLNTNLPTYGVDTSARIAAFLSQCAHESGDFTHLQENLNYGAPGLLAVFPSHFDADSAAQYARNPQMIGNRVYADRMGNGDEDSGDGYNYRGRGLIMLTGKSNYHVCSQSLYGDDRLIDTPQLVETDYNTAILTALWFWNSNNLNVPADASDIVSITRKINGGQIGYADRLSRYNNAMAVLQS